MLYIAPKWDLELPAEAVCDECGEPFGDEDDIYFDRGDRYWCEVCSTVIEERERSDSDDYAREHCRITRSLPQYRPMHEFRCTREEYEAGCRESYTRNSHLCYCRHRCTNYEELISGLDRDSPLDNIFYSAIRERIDEMLTDAIDEMGDDWEEDEFL